MDILNWIHKISINFFPGWATEYSQTQTKKLCIRFASKIQNHFGINFSFFFQSGQQTILKPNTIQNKTKSVKNIYKLQIIIL